MIQTSDTILALSAELLRQIDEAELTTRRRNRYRKIAETIFDSAFGLELSLQRIEDTRV